MLLLDRTNWYDDYKDEDRPKGQGNPLCETIHCAVCLASTCQGTFYRWLACKIGYEFRLTLNSEPQEINKKSIATWRPALSSWWIMEKSGFSATTNPSMTGRDNPVQVFWITRDPVKLLVPRPCFSTSLSLHSFSFCTSFLSSSVDANSRCKFASHRP